MRAAAETRASNVIAPFENLNNSLIDDCEQRLVFTRIVRNVSSIKRILTVFTPTSETRADLLLFIAEIKHLLHQTSSDAAFYMTQNQRNEISPTIDRYLKGAVKYKIVVKSHWNTIKRDLPNDIRDDDAIAVAMGTRQKFFRSPALDKYPLHLAHRFPQNNIFAVYSPLSLVESESSAILFEEDVPRRGESSKIQTLETESANFEDIISAITLKTGVERGEIHDILLSSLELYPVELITGVVLIHAHIENIEEPKVFLWLQKEKREILPAQISPNVLIIVLNPLKGDPQIHLKTLSRIAGIFTNPKCPEIIENARNCEDLLKDLQNL
jgi:mannitol/fructose-specific phosphotransferase system IIA component (Ntr-type)